MVSEIQKCLAKELKLILPRATIYIQSMKQGLKLPCFFITRTKMTMMNALIRTNRRISFVISYIGDDQDIIEEALLQLETVDVFHLTNREIEVVDDVLQFSFEIQIREELLDTGVLMEKGKVEEGVK